MNQELEELREDALEERSHLEEDLKQESPRACSPEEWDNTLEEDQKEDDLGNRGSADPQECAQVEWNQVAEDSNQAESAALPV